MKTLEQQFEELLDLYAAYLQANGSDEVKIKQDIMDYLEDERDEFVMEGNKPTSKYYQDASH